MKALSKFNIAILFLSTFIALTACSSGDNQPTPKYRYQQLYRFTDIPDGKYPRGGVIQGSDGNLYGTTQRGGTGSSAEGISGIGTIFKLTLQGQKTVLYSFNNSTGGFDGAYPYAGLLQGSDGNLYGTTFGGGTKNRGAVFKITTQGQETILYSFSGNTSGSKDGASPQAGLLQGSDGNLYGTAYDGGAGKGYGTVFKVTPQGQYTSLVNFGGGTDGAYPYASLTQASGGAYGTTAGGGLAIAPNSGTVFKLTSSGKTTVYTFAGGNDGVNPTGLIQASDGNLYGTTIAGGANNNGTVFKVTPSGVKTTLYSFSGGTDGAYPQAGLLQATDGNLYGTTRAGGNGNGTVFKITTQGQKTTIYNFGGGTDGAYPYASLIQASDGNFYGTTYGGGNGNGTVFKIMFSRRVNMTVPNLGIRLLMFIKALLNQTKNM